MMRRRRPLMRTAMVAGGAAAVGAAAGPSQETLERLKQLGQLHEQGILTDEEFAREKAKLL
jgi:putative oligomerization/nucleic acid binding protein